MEKQTPEELAAQWAAESLRKSQKKSNRRGQTIRKNTLSKHGVTLEQFDAMFEAQDGYCGLCGRHHSEFTRAFGIDRNPSTREIRGLLCNPCNAAVSIFEKRAGEIQSYLDSHYIP